MNGTTATASVARDLFAGAAEQEAPANRWSGGDPNRVIYLKTRIGGPGGVLKEFKGRPAQTLAKLLAAGRHGITSRDFAAGMRVSHYIFRLRGEGVQISMTEERFEGVVSGTYGRYRLCSAVSVIEIREARP